MQRASVLYIMQVTYDNDYHVYRVQYIEHWTRGLVSILYFIPVLLCVCTALGIK